MPRDHVLDLGDIRLHYVTDGPHDGPLVVLLHGVPEFWYCWRHQVPALAAAGRRVVALDMRGFNESSKPRGVAAYRDDVVAGDVVQLIERLGGAAEALVGHDWGGTVAWRVAMDRPDLLQRLVVINAPHPERILSSLRDPRQWLRSAYVLGFQLPWLPEAMLRAGHFRRLRRTLERDPLRPGAFTIDDIARYLRAWSQPGAMTAMVNYYRAAVRRRPGEARRSWKRVELPVLVIWGQQDRYLGPALAEPSPEWVPNARVERLDEASHWVPADQPERVNELLLQFLETAVG